MDPNGTWLPQRPTSLGMVFNPAGGFTTPGSDGRDVEECGGGLGLGGPPSYQGEGPAGYGCRCCCLNF